MSMKKVFKNFKNYNSKFFEIKLAVATFLKILSRSIRAKRFVFLSFSRFLAFFLTEFERSTKLSRFSSQWEKNKLSAFFISEKNGNR